MWEKKKLKTRGKPVVMRGDCQKGELFAAQREVQSKLLSRRARVSLRMRTVPSPRHAARPPQPMARVGACGRVWAHVGACRRAWTLADVR